ncbi:MAG: indole-3-glycerol phosphate synthase TrpC [Alphaproteobacteria bacterium]
MSKLDDIVAARIADVAALKRRAPLTELKERLAAAPKRRDFLAALRQPGTPVIAELKRRSPSAGDIRPGADASTIAAGYAAAGARALSIVTEPRFFSGKDEDLVIAREASGLPVLRKDFVVDSYQIMESRALGADADLLMVSVLGPRTAEMLARADDLGLDALVEVHDESELAIALDARARIVGINNRNLKTMHVDLATTERLAPSIPPHVLCVAESGISARTDIERLRRAGAGAFLIGSSLMSANDPREALAELIRAKAA